MKHFPFCRYNKYIYQKHFLLRNDELKIKIPSISCFKALIWFNDTIVVFPSWLNIVHFKYVSKSDVLYSYCVLHLCIAFLCMLLNNWITLGVMPTIVACCHVTSIMHVFHSNSTWSACTIKDNSRTISSTKLVYPAMKSRAI